MHPPMMNQESLRSGDPNLLIANADDRDKSPSWIFMDMCV